MMTTAAMRFGQQKQLVIQQWLSEARQTGEKDAYSGKRSFPRFSWEAPVTVEILEGPDAGLAFFATTRDISVAGMGIRSRHRLERGAAIRITLDSSGHWLESEVSHSSETLGGFIVGVEFQ